MDPLVSGSLEEVCEFLDSVGIGAWCGGLSPDSRCRGAALQVGGQGAGRQLPGWSWAEPAPARSLSSVLGMSCRGRPKPGSWAPAAVWALSRSRVPGQTTGPRLGLSSPFGVLQPSGVWERPRGRDRDNVGSNGSEATGVTSVVGPTGLMQMRCKRAQLIRPGQSPACLTGQGRDLVSSLLPVYER